MAFADHDATARAGSAAIARFEKHAFEATHGDGVALTAGDAAHERGVTHTRAAVEQDCSNAGVGDNTSTEAPSHRATDGAVRDTVQSSPHHMPHAEGILLDAVDPASSASMPNTDAGVAAQTDASAIAQASGGAGVPGTTVPVVLSSAEENAMGSDWGSGSDSTRAVPSALRLFPLFASDIATVATEPQDATTRVLLQMVVMASNHEDGAIDVSWPCTCHDSEDSVFRTLQRFCFSRMTCDVLQTLRCSPASLKN